MAHSSSDNRADSPAVTSGISATIVERLRFGGPEDPVVLMAIAADEIERLRRALQSIALCTDDPAIRNIAKDGLGEGK
jgi:mannitol/fructose-specific phosphotransferase system IIA component (Ntr-type)